MSYIFLIIAFSLNSAANILLKLNSSDGVSLSSHNFFQIISANRLVILALFLFAVNIIFYFLSLKNLPLSIAYPVMTAMTFIIVNLVCLRLLKEPITPMQILGYLLVLLGICFVVFFAKKTA